MAPLWENVLNDEQAQGSIQLLRGITCLKKMDEKVFMVELSSGNMEFFLQSNAKGLETIMQKYTSRTLRMEYTITPGSGDPFQGLEEAEQQAFDDF